MIIQGIKHPEKPVIATKHHSTKAKLHAKKEMKERMKGKVSWAAHSTNNFAKHIRANARFYKWEKISAKINFW